mmetsp:Transcript_60216/g.193872  ORF Transcript_60216/g.193872 Transcript_60216/m.193872 type:complete len:134 (-) Transcript_60216:155-556(-)
MAAARPRMLSLAVLVVGALLAWKAAPSLFVNTSLHSQRGLRAGTSLQAKKNEKTLLVPGKLIYDPEGRMTESTGSFEFSKGARNQVSLIAPDITTEHITDYLSVNVVFFFILIMFTMGGLIEAQRFWPDALWW